MIMVNKTILTTITHDYQGTGSQYAKARKGTPDFIRLMIEKSGLVELAEQAPRRHFSIVEFGAGSGQQTFHMERELGKAGISDYDILAIDKSSSQLVVLKDRIRRGEISDRVSPVEHNLDGGGLLIPEGQIDLSYMALVIHHLADKAQGIREIARVSKSGAGLFVYSAALEDLESHILNEFFPKYEYDARRCPTYEQMKELFEQAGFNYKGPQQIKANNVGLLDNKFLEAVENKTADSVLVLIENERPDLFMEGVRNLRFVVEKSKRTGKFRQITTYPTTVFWGVKI